MAGWQVKSIRDAIGCLSILYISWEEVKVSETTNTSVDAELYFVNI